MVVPHRVSCTLLPIQVYRRSYSPFTALSGGPGRPPVREQRPVLDGDSRDVLGRLLRNALAWLAEPR
jgi:hypothetical protein